MKHINRRYKIQNRLINTTTLRFSAPLSINPIHTTMPQQPPTILLLKTKSTPEDKYDALFRSKDFSPEFIPVLTHHFHSDALSSIHHLFTSGALAPGPNRRYGGLIFTSQRAVEGFRGVLEGVERKLPPYPIRECYRRPFRSLSLGPLDVYKPGGASMEIVYS